MGLTRLSDNQKVAIYLALRLCDGLEQQPCDRAFMACKTSEPFPLRPTCI